MSNPVDSSIDEPTQGLRCALGATGANLRTLLELDTWVQLIQALIPNGLEAVNEVLQQEVRRLAGELGRSFKTTNGIETLNSLIGNRTGKVNRWPNSEQKQRWLATAILNIEPRLRTVVGYRQLPRRRAAMQSSSNRIGKVSA